MTDDSEDDTVVTLLTWQQEGDADAGCNDIADDDDDLNNAGGVGGDYDGVQEPPLLLSGVPRLPPNTLPPPSPRSAAAAGDAGGPTDSQGPYMDPEYMALCDAQYDMQHGLGGEPQHSQRRGRTRDEGPDEETDSHQQQVHQCTWVEFGPRNIQYRQRQSQWRRAERE